MLLYDNRTSLRILLQVKGGVVWDLTGLGLFVALVTVFINDWLRAEGDGWKPVYKDTFSAVLFSSPLTFALVYRTETAWSKYWEAIYHLQVMFSQWLEACILMMSFMNTTEKILLEQEDSARKLIALRKLRRRLVHDFSLLSALTVHRLVHGDVGRMRRLSERLWGGRAWRRCLCCLCRFWQHWNKLILYRENLRYEDVTTDFHLPIFRTIELHERNTPAKAELQTGMSAEKHKLMSYRNARSSATLMRRGISSLQELAEMSKSMTLSSSAGVNVTWSSDLVVLCKLSDEEKRALAPELDLSNNHFVEPHRVGLVLTWLEEDFNMSVDLLEVPSPIVSQAYERLSRGSLGFEQALKVSDMPYPFPASQMLDLLLVVFTVAVVPLTVANFTSGIFMSPCLAAIVTMAFWSLHHISCELETPFADGPNQLPLINSHEQFVESLRRSYFSRRPDDFEDDGKFDKYLEMREGAEDLRDLISALSSETGVPTHESEGGDLADIPSDVDTPVGSALWFLRGSEMTEGEDDPRDYFYI